MTHRIDMYDYDYSSNSNSSSSNSYQSYIPSADSIALAAANKRAEELARQLEEKNYETVFMTFFLLNLSDTDRLAALTKINSKEMKQYYIKQNYLPEVYYSLLLEEKGIFPDKTVLLDYYNTLLKNGLNEMLSYISDKQIRATADSLRNKLLQDYQLNSDDGPIFIKKILSTLVFLLYFKRGLGNLPRSDSFTTQAIFNLVSRINLRLPTHHRLALNYEIQDLDPEKFTFVEGSYKGNTLLFKLGSFEDFGKLKHFFVELGKELQSGMILTIDDDHWVKILDCDDPHQFLKKLHKNLLASIDVAMHEVDWDNIPNVLGIEPESAFPLELAPDEMMDEIGLYLNLSDIQRLKILNKKFKPFTPSYQTLMLNHFPNEYNELLQEQKLPSESLLADRYQECSERLYKGLPQKIIYLFNAVKEGSISKLKSFTVDLNNLVYTNDNDGYTPIDYANQAVLNYFYSLVCEIHATMRIKKPIEGFSLLHWAVYTKQSMQLINDLLKSPGENVNGITANGYSILGLAVRGKDFAYIKSIAILPSTNVNLGGGSNYPLTLAIKMGNLEILQYLFSLSTVNQHLKIFLSIKPLFRHARNMLGPYENFNLLQYAVYQGTKIEIIEFLLNHFSIEVKSNSGCSILQLAVLQNHFDLIKFFIENKNVNVNFQTVNGKETALHIACNLLTKFNNLNVIMYLSSLKNINLLLENDDKQTPLDLIETLLETSEGENENLMRSAHDIVTPFDFLQRMKKIKNYLTTAFQEFKKKSHSEQRLDAISRTEIYLKNFITDDMQLDYALKALIDLAVFLKLKENETDIDHKKYKSIFASVTKSSLVEIYQKALTYFPLSVLILTKKIITNAKTRSELHTDAKESNNNATSPSTEIKENKTDKKSPKRK